jgi:hypothetical protein
VFVARRPFLHNGKNYAPGDIVKGYPKDFGYRSESFIRGGLIVEKADKRPRKVVMEEVKPE